MIRKTWFASVVLILFVVPPARGQLPLQWKLKEGQSFYIEETAALNLSCKGAGEEQKEEATSTILSRVTVLKELADHGVLVEQQIESSKTKSAGKAETEDAAMKGAKFRMTFGPTMRVTHFEGYDDLARRQSGGSAEAEKTFRAEMSEAEVGRRASEPFNLFLPDADIAPGEGWAKTRDITVGPLGSMSMTLKYTPAGRETIDGRPVEKIAIKGEAKHTLPKPAAGAAFQFSKGHLKCDAIEGMVLFDNQIGRLVRIEVKIPFAGPLTIAGGGAEVEMQCSGLMNQTIRMFDSRKREDAPAAK